MESNKDRIKEIDILFGNSYPPLFKENRTLVGEGSLIKMCRKTPKKRQFYLFSDILVYCKYIWNGRKLTSQHVFSLQDVEVEEVKSTEFLEYGFIIRSPQKSFIVYAASYDERDQWIRHLKNCIFQCSIPCKEPVTKSPIWVPDDKVQTCMVCRVSTFNFLKRRHHCRKCGKLVCEKCSQKRFLIPEISNSTVRVCDVCYYILSQIQ